MGDDASVHGVLVVDKPRGPTSHDIVAQARRLFRTRRIGHTGTLDPMATGVLVLLVGEATKLSGVLAADEKVYRARVRFGFSTDTDDAFGVPTATAPIHPESLSEDRVALALNTERARREQLPPTYSAIKQNGQPLYKKARLGIAVDAGPRLVSVKTLELVEIGPEHIDLLLHCSKGYYVRALARDLGRALDCPAHLSALRRTRAGQFDIANASPWPLLSAPAVASLVEVARLALHCCELNGAGVERARQGKQLGVEHFAPNCLPIERERPMAWLFENRLVAIGKWSDATSMRVERGFNT